MSSRTDTTTVKGLVELSTVNVAVTELREPRTVDTLLCHLIAFSFFFELPLAQLTPFDRTNPRLFDIAVLLSALFTRWKRNRNNLVLRAWESVVVVFVVCALISATILLPLKYGKFSLFYGFKYLESLLSLWILTGFSWSDTDRDKLFRTMCYGIILAGIWGLCQHLGLITSIRELPNGEQIITQKGIILATFGSTYFHSGFMGAMMAFIAVLQFSRRKLPLFLFSVTFSFALFLALFSGSRAGVAVVTLLLGGFFFKSPRALFIIGCAVLIITQTDLFNYIIDNGVTFQRILSRSTHNSIDARIGHSWAGDILTFIDFHGGSALLVGGGFYAVPMPNPSGVTVYRVGYGLHNIHLFPLEQAGIPGFLVAAAFWTRLLLFSYKNRKTSLAYSCFLIALAIVVVGWTGQIFYYGFGTENMVAGQVATMALLLQELSAGENAVPPRPSSNNELSVTAPRLIP